MQVLHFNFTHAFFSIENLKKLGWPPKIKFHLQSIVESPTGQLKLGEIYTWFSNNFKHFRTTCNLTWKVTTKLTQKLLFTSSIFQTVPIFLFLIIVPYSDGNYQTFQNSFHRTWISFVSFPMGLMIALQVRLSFFGTIHLANYVFAFQNRELLNHPTTSFP